MVSMYVVVMYQTLQCPVLLLQMQVQNKMYKILETDQYI